MFSAKWGLPNLSIIHYLAYGSNLHPLRLTLRVPSARVIGVVEMPGYMLEFHKRSIDGSGKCLIYTEQGEHHKMGLVQIRVTVFASILVSI